MCDIAHISSSPLGSASYSEQVGEHVTRDREKDSDASLTDQAKVPLPHIDDDFVAATSLEPKCYPQSTNGQPGIRMGVHNHSVWRKFLDAVLEPRTLADENGIIEYLRCYRHDLPPAVWIENRPLRPD
jgi:hypothetical protein